MVICTIMTRLWFIVVMTSIVHIECKVSSIETAYQKGVSAYSEERWSECITQFEDSLHLFKLYKSVTVNCRMKCKSHPFKVMIKDNIEDLQAFEKFFQIKNCLNSCQEKSFNDINVESELHPNIFYIMEARKPYEYLHLCYFQIYALPKAASAAYTFLTVNPEDESMKNNLVYYVQQPEVNPNEVSDLEIEDYKVLYSIGIKAYNQNNWADTVANLEEVMVDYFSTENICRAECERQPDQETSPEFIITISNNIASLLHCQQQCQKKLLSLNYDSGVEFLADILNYLQISYYHLEKFEKAATTAETYLKLLPSDEDMLANKKIYSSLVVDKEFKERSDIVFYLNRDTYEKKLLNLFHQRDIFDSQSNDISG